MAWPKVKNVADGVRKGDMHWHLQWCRRRQEDASFLVMEVPSKDAGFLNRLLAEFRVTDSVVAAKTTTGFEIQAVLDDHALARTGVERRFQALSCDLALQFGWASFPKDGLTMEVLLDEARHAIAVTQAAAITSQRPGRNPQRALDNHLKPVDA